MVRLMPVLPEVPSYTVSIFASVGMESRIARATRSFGEPPGLRNYISLRKEGRTSAFARISQPVTLERDRIRINLVLPIRPSTPSTMSSVNVVSSSESVEQWRRELFMRRYVVEVPKTIPKERRRRDFGREEKDILGRCRSG